MDSGLRPIVGCWRFVHQWILFSPLIKSDRTNFVSEPSSSSIRLLSVDNPFLIRCWILVVFVRSPLSDYDCTKFRSEPLFPVSRWLSVGNPFAIFSVSRRGGISICLPCVQANISAWILLLNGPLDCTDRNRIVVFGGEEKSRYGGVLCEDLNTVADNAKHQQFWSPNCLFIFLEKPEHILPQKSEV